MKSKVLYSSLLFLLLLTVCFLCGKMILSGDFFYLADQARDYLLTQDIVDNKNITLIGTHSGLGGFFHGPLWLYMLTPFYIVGGGDPFIFTYAYVLIAVLTVYVGYIVGARLYDKNAGLLLAFFLAVSPTIWAFVPNTIGVNVVPLVFLLLFYFLTKYIRGETNAFIFAIFFAGLSLQFETALPLIIIPVVFASFFLNKKALRKPKVILLSVVSFVVSIATFILFDVRHNFLMLRSLFAVSSGGKQEGYLAFPERLTSHMESLLSVYMSLLIQNTFLLKLLFVILLLTFVGVLIKKKLYKEKQFKEFIFLLLFPVIIFGFYLFYPYPIFPEYVLGLSIPVSFAMIFIFNALWKEKFGKILLMLFFLVTLFEAGKLIASPHQQDQTSGSYKNQKEAAEWIFNDSNQEQFGYYVYTPATYTYGMDYLLWWESKKRNVTKPESQKLTTTYLILYPTLKNDPGAHAFWKKYKIKTQGNVVARQTFRGGIVVEKLAIKPGEGPADSSYHQNLLFR